MWNYCNVLRDDGVSYGDYEDSENLPPPDTIAKEIAENLESALEQFSSIYEELESRD